MFIQTDDHGACANSDFHHASDRRSRVIYIYIIGGPMATYFHGNSEIQGDGLQTMILMNPSYVGYSDTHDQPPAPNFVLLNSATAAGNSIHPQNLSHASPTQTQQFVSFSLQASTSAAGSASPHDPHHPSVHSLPDISALHGLIPRVHYNTYSSIDPTAESEMAPTQQRLSLSLSSQQKVHWAPQTVSPASGGHDVGVSGRSPSSATRISNDVNEVQRSLLSSKYLKAVQELLDEVVNVGKGVKNELGKRKTKTTGPSYESSAVAGEGLNGRRTSVKGGAELTTTERQEIQMKKAKLFNMLKEVQERYRQYHNQMDMMICWFEQVAGIGSAKTYTALALETISRQSRCLKDAIRGQIRAASKSLGEEESFRGRTGEVSRLKLVDNQLRLQQRALQHLGMIQPNAWRPQRGLPERSVSVLRAWLFEHFLHPYPKDSDKVMLAKQTGLTRSQVSNWFINARVRLWKPMVEEMYLEETKEQEQIKGSEDKTNEDLQTDTQQQNPPPLNISVNIGKQTESLIPQGSPKKQRTLETLLSPNANAVHLTNFNGGFGSLTQIGEIGRFGADQFPATYSGNNGTVSLTLGLPHRENLSISGTPQSFLPNPLAGRVEIIEPNEFGNLNTPTTSSHSTAVYDQDIDLRNQKRFIAQLLPDFVA